MVSNEENKFDDYFNNQFLKYGIHKWLHYFDIYERHMSKYKDKNPFILEIGIEKGGSLCMWNYYFDNNCTIYGVDIDQSCKKLDIPNCEIFIGDQSDERFWEMFKSKVSKVDIIIDDGGHTMKQQITTFKCLYDYLDDDGIYLCEDTHTSYLAAPWGGGLKKPNTFIEFAKSLIDDLHACHFNGLSTKIRDITNSISFYDSVVVFEKRKNKPPVSVVKEKSKRHIKL